MDIKKNPNVDLQRYRTLFFLVGIVIALGAVLVAFEWPTKELVVQDITFDEDSKSEDEMVPITQQEQPKPQEAPPVVVLSPTIVITNDPQTNTDMSLFDERSLSENIAIMPVYEGPKEVEVIEEIPFAAVEDPPKFGKNGTLDDFRNWINANLDYPDIAVETGLQGRVHMQFAVNHLGKVVNVKVLRGVDPLLDAEAERVIKMSPDWTPGKQSGKAVRVLYNIPVVFRLN